MDKPVLFRQFNLSRNETLRTLETTAESVTAAGDAALGSLRTILSTVTSPMLLDLVIVYLDSDIDVNRYRKPELEYRAACARRHHQEIGGLLVMPFKSPKIVIRSRKGYNGPVLAVKGYEPTRISE